MLTRAALKQMLLECSPCGAIFFSILAVKVVHYDLQPKTSKLTPSELTRNSSQHTFFQRIGGKELFNFPVHIGGHFYDSCQ